MAPFLHSQQWRRFVGDSGRIVGLDIARGLAVLGMVCAHVGVKEDWHGAVGWLAVFDGRSAILFAMLAGVSLTIISGRPEPAVGWRAVQARTRILVRAAMLFAIGGVLVLAGTQIAVILEFYAAMFVLALPFLRWPAQRLFVLAGGIAVVAPVVIGFLTPLLPNLPYSDPNISVLLVTGMYPVLLYMAYVALGLGLGRSCWTTVAKVRMVVAGAGLAIVGYGLPAIIRRLVPAVDSALDDAAAYAPATVFDPLTLITAEPHSDTPFEAVASGGVAMAVLGLCLLAGKRVRYALAPLAAVGSMALTAYVGHIAVLASIDGGIYTPSNGLLLGLLMGIIVFCSAWSLVFGRGPLERLLSWVSHRASDPSVAPEAAP